MLPLDQREAVVATVEEIISRLQAAGQKISEGIQLLGAAETVAGQLQAQMAAVGVIDKAAQFTRVKDSIQRTRQHLAGGHELVNQSVSAAKQAAG